MRLQRALPALLAAALLTAGAAGCGVKTNDDIASGPSDRGNPSISTTTEAKGSGTGGSEGTMPKRSTTTRPSRPTTTSDFGGTTTTSAFTTPGPGPGGDFDVRSSLIDTYENLGLSNDQATCLTDGFLDSGIMDPSNPGATPDLSQMTDLFATCNISMSDFGGSDLGD